MGMPPGEAIQPKSCTENLADTSPGCAGQNSPFDVRPIRNFLLPQTGNCPTDVSSGGGGNGPSPAGSTYVGIELFEAQSSPVNSRGGRQRLNFYGGAVDLSWHFNSKFDTAYDADLPYFKPAGIGATFGYLAWYHYSGHSNNFQHYLTQGKKGISYVIPSGTAPLDPRSSEFYIEDQMRYHQQEDTYYWYDPRYPNNNPRYVSRRIRRDGTCIYYTYDQTYYRLDSMSGDTGRLVAYFGYNSSHHISRMYLQDKLGADNRETYYYYNGDTLSHIVEPEDVVTYFTIDAANIHVKGEVDPDNFPTYLVYNTANPFYLNRLVHASQVTYFSVFPSYQYCTMSYRMNGASRGYQRTYIGLGTYKVDNQGVEGGNQYFLYNASTGLPGTFYDRNGNARNYSYSSRKLLDRKQEPDQSVIYYNYTNNQYDIESITGPRNSIQLNQAVYFSYLPGGSGTISQYTNEIGATSYYGYDTRNRLVRQQQPNNGIQYYLFDQYDQKYCEIDAQGAHTYFQYNANLQPLRRQNALGKTAYFAYDKLDQRIAQYSETGDVQYFSYTKRGLLSASLRSGGRVAYYSYNSVKNVTRQSNLFELGLATQYFEYDANDNLAVQMNSLGFKNQNLFDWNHRPGVMQRPDGVTNYFWYDGNGNVLYQGGPIRFWKSNRYDSRDRLVVSTLGVVGPRAPLTGITYYAHWSMDETTGPRFDSTLRNNLLYPQSGASYGPGIIGNAGNLEAAPTAYFCLDNTSINRLSITGDLTLACWVRSTKPLSNSFHIIAGKDEAGTAGYVLYFQAPDQIFFTAITTGGTALLQYKMVWALENWNHIAVTRNATNGDLCLYVNGWLVQRNLFNHPIGQITTCTNPFMIGARQYGATANHFFSGYIDNVYVLDRALNYAEIAQLCNSRLTPTYAAENTDIQTSYFGYDADNNLVQQLNERNFASYFQYDASSRMIVAQDATGSASYYRYDLMSNRTAVLNPRGAVSYFGYDLVNRMLRATDALNQTNYFGYDLIGNQTRRLSPGKIVEYFSYDGSNRLVAQTDPGLNSTYFAYDGVSNRTRILNPRRYATYFVYNLLDQNTAVLDATGQPSYFVYDTEGNLRATWDHVSGANGAATYFGYDGVNRLTVSRDPLKRVSYFGYDQADNQTRIALPGNRNSYFGYDRFSRLIAQRSPAGNASYFAYDRANNRTTVRNPRGFSTYFGFDALNRVDRTLDALLGVSYFAYDAVGNLIRSRDVRSYTTYYSYDLLDRLTVTTDAIAGVTQRAYDPAGNVHKVLPPAGNAVYFAYDTRRLPTATVDGMANVTYYGYDANRNRTQLLSPRAYGSYFNYDALDRMENILDAEGATAYFGYDAGGNLNRVRDAMGRPTYFQFDLLDRPEIVFDALNYSVYFGYDSAGNRAVERDARLNSTYYRYDLDDRLTTIRDPLGKSAYYGYDQNSNLSKTLDNNKTVVYFGYDRLDRRTAIKYPSENQYFAYDASGNLVAMLDGWGISYFAYDGLSRSTARSTPRGDAVYYLYDAASSLTAWQYPQDGKACYYGYDGAQRMTKLLSPLGNAVYYEYDPSSNVTKKTLGNGTVSWATFDRVERFNVLRYTQPNGSALAYFDYGRDVSGRIVRIARETDLVQYYEYDALDRLTAETWRKKSDYSQIYAFMYEYDPTGNRLRMRREKTANVEWDSAYYSYAADDSLQQRQVLTPPSTIVNTYYGYDANGALTRQMEGADTTYFEYGPNQLVTKVTPPAAEGLPWQFYYDGRLNRYKIDRGGTIRFLLWDGLNCMEERNSDGSLHARYTYGYTRIYGIGSNVEIFKPGVPNKTYTLLMDHRGTAHTLLDETRTEIGRRYYDAFGVMLGQTGTWPTDLAYQTNWQTVQIGQEWWAITQYRLMNIKIGAFISRDFRRTFNLYRCWSNNPVNRVDNNGLEETDVDTYTVVAGDTFNGIAKKLNISADKLKELNKQISDFNRIKPGQKIFFPKPSSPVTPDKPKADVPADKKLEDDVPPFDDIAKNQKRFLDSLIDQLQKDFKERLRVDLLSKLEANCAAVSNAIIDELLKRLSEIVKELISELYLVSEELLWIVYMIYLTQNGTESQAKKVAQKLLNNAAQLSKAGFDAYVDKKLEGKSSSEKILGKAMAEQLFQALFNMLQKGAAGTLDPKGVLDELKKSIEKGARKGLDDIFAKGKDQAGKIRDLCLCPIEALDPETQKKVRDFFKDFGKGVIPIGTNVPRPKE